MQGVDWKDRNFAINTLLLILQHFKQCPLKSSPIYRRYTVPNVSSIVGIHFGNQENVFWCYVWWIRWWGQRMSDVLSDNCGRGATRELAHCRGATSKFGFPNIQASSCAQHPSNALKLPGTTVCLTSDHVVQIHDGRCLYNQKTQPTPPWSLTDSSMLWRVGAEETLTPFTATIASWLQHHTHKLTSQLLLWCS